MDKVCNSYRYLFYKYATWDRYSWRNKFFSSASQTSLYALTFLIGMNFFSLLVIMQIFLGVGFDQIGNSKIKILAIGGFFLVINYLILVHNKKYEKIFQKFENEDNKSRVIGNIFAWIYIILTFITLGLSAFFLGNSQTTKNVEKNQDKILINQDTQFFNQNEKNLKKENVSSKILDNDKLILPSSSR